MDISQSNPMIVQGVPPLMTGGVQGPQAPHPQGYIQQFQPQSHQFNATASMMQANAVSNFITFNHVFSKSYCTNF